MQNVFGASNATSEHVEELLVVMMNVIRRNQQSIFAAVAIDLALHKDNICIRMTN